MQNYNHIIYSEKDENYLMELNYSSPKRIDNTNLFWVSELKLDSPEVIIIY